MLTHQEWFNALYILHLLALQSFVFENCILQALKMPLICCTKEFPHANVFYQGKLSPGADYSGKWGFKVIKRGFVFNNLPDFFQKFPHETEINWSQRWGGGSSEPPDTPPNPPLYSVTLLPPPRSLAPRLGLGTTWVRQLRSGSCHHTIAASKCNEQPR